MSIFQILATCFGLFMLYVVSIHHKKAALARLEVSFWYTTWICFVVIAIFPQLLEGLSGVLRFARVFDLLVVGALMILTVVIISSYFHQKVTQRRLDELVRKIAIRTKVQNVKKIDKIKKK